MKKISLFLISILVLVVVFSLALGVGSVSLNWGSLSLQDQMILFDIRLPRVLFALLAGAALAVAGAIMQGLLQNPLADPFVLGVSSGASLGAVLAMVLGVFSLFIPAFAFIGAILTIGLVYFLARGRGRFLNLNLILAGLVVNSFFSALVMLLIYISGSKFQGIMYWIMGDLGSGDKGLLGLVGIAVFIGIFMSMFYFRELNILSNGEEQALQVGLDVEKTKKTLFVVASLLTGAVVSVCGIIGFVGLIIPHAVRAVFGANYKILLPACAIWGAGFLILADILSRMLISNVEIPIGVVTALFGGPFFLYLMRREAK